MMHNVAGKDVLACSLVKGKRKYERRNQETYVGHRVDRQCWLLAESDLLAVSGLASAPWRHESHRL